MTNFSLNIRPFPSNLLYSCISLEPLQTLAHSHVFIGLEPLNTNENV